MAELQVGDFSTEIYEAGTGPTVVLCHGSASDHRTWHDQLYALNAGGYRTINYSRRYHWPNPPESDGTKYSMAEHVEDLVVLINEVATEPVHLVGHSYGGFVALLVAERHRELVRSLVVIEPPVVPLFLSDPPKPAELVQVLRRRPRLGVALLKFGATGLVPATKAATKGDMAKALRHFGTAVLGKERFTQLSPERLKQAQANNIRAEYLTGSLDPLTDGQVRSVETRTCVVSGEHSPRLWPMLADYMDELLPNSQRVRIQNAGHIAHEDNPGAFNQCLLDFLAADIDITEAG